MNCPRCSEHCCDCRDIDEVAELRAYKERTEAALRELCERVGDHGACVACYKLLALGLWRDKEPAKLKEGP